MWGPGPSSAPVTLGKTQRAAHLCGCLWAKLSLRVKGDGCLNPLATQPPGSLKTLVTKPLGA